MNTPIIIILPFWLVMLVASSAVLVAVLEIYRVYLDLKLAQLQREHLGEIKD